MNFLRRLHLPQSAWGLFIFVCLFHLGFALFLKFVIGFDIEADPHRNTWDWFWQTLPVDLLQNRLGESLWNFHAQPPLFNLYGTFFIKLFFPHHLLAMHFGNMLLGSLLAGMAFWIVLNETGHKTFSLVMGLFIAVNPALVLYEAYILYPLLCAFLLMLTFFYLSVFKKTQNPKFLIAFIAALNALILTRTAFHLFLLVFAIPFVALLVKHSAKKVVVACALISLLSFGWYGKNFLKFDFFGASSWFGQNLWKIAIVNHTKEERIEIYRNGILNPMMFQVKVFRLPKAYEPFGFRKTSPIPALSRNDYNNINIIAISNAFKRNATRLIVEEPFHYYANIFRAYGIFCIPSSRHVHLRFNRARIVGYESFFVNLFEGRFLGKISQRFFGKNYVGSAFFFLFPLTILFYLKKNFQGVPLSWQRLMPRISRDPVLVALTFLFVYSIAVCCFFEYGENHRFKFTIESLFFAYVAILGFRVWKNRTQTPV